MNHLRGRKNTKQKINYLGKEDDPSEKASSPDHEIYA